MGLIGGLILLIIVGILIFWFSVFIMNEVFDYRDDLNSTENDSITDDPDYKLGHTMEEKEKLIENSTIAPGELAG